MANKKRYVTYAPYHEEYLLYPCTFRGPDYACNNPDAPRYTRTCYAKYRCNYDHNDPLWFKKYQEVQERNQSKNEKLIQSKTKISIRDIEFDRFGVHSKYYREMERAYKYWPNVKNFKNAKVLAGYNEKVNDAVLEFQKWAKISKLEADQYAKAKRKSLMAFQEIIEYVDDYVLLKFYDGKHPLRASRVCYVASKNNIQCIFDSFSKINFQAVDNAAKIFIKHVLAGVPFDNTKQYNFYG